METHHSNIDRPDVFCVLVLSIDTENVLVALFKPFKKCSNGVSRQTERLEYAEKVARAFKKALKKAARQVSLTVQ
jgi:hypothetical protein